LCWFCCSKDCDTVPDDGYDGYDRYSYTTLESPSPKSASFPGS
jgi:hypothetical protein